MTSEQTLKKGDRLESQNGKFYLELQSDGNLVLNNDVRVLWSTKTNNGSQLVLQKDGNLVLTNVNNKEVFSTRTNKGRYFSVQNNGNLVLYDDNSKPLWSTKTTQCKFPKKMFHLKS